MDKQELREKIVEDWEKLDYGMEDNPMDYFSEEEWEQWAKLIEGVEEWKRELEGKESR